MRTEVLKRELKGSISYAKEDRSLEGGKGSRNYAKED
jgi:hypothetical protein